MSTILRCGKEKFDSHYRYRPLSCLIAAALGTCVLTCGCGKVDLGALAKDTLAQTGHRADDQSIGAQPLGPEDLQGHSLAEVKRVLGQPQGKLRTQDGEVWLYADWRVLLDSEDRVASVEPEAAVKVAASSSSNGAASARPLTVVANGGQEVDLAALMPSGKVTIVDFYADWCGPCRRISPNLEQIAQSDPDVVLVKVDIVNWGTPVTRQYGINSVPNIRVFNRRNQAVGQPTSDLNAVQRYVAQAKRG